MSIRCRPDLIRDTGSNKSSIPALLGRYRDTGISGIQGYRDTGIQGYRDTGIQGYRDTWIQGYQGYRDT